jgi:elongation factor P
MKIDTSKIKKGTVLKIEGKLFRVTDIGHTHMGRGGATYNFKVKDIISGKTNTFTYNASTILEEAEVRTNSATFLYSAGDSYTFMENDTGEMHDIEEDVIDDLIPFLKENLECHVMTYEGNIIGVILPATIEFTISSTVPGIKGNRSQAGTKPATIETGHEIQVPLHKNE